MLDLARIRADLPAVEARTYLNAGTFGPIPEPVRAAMAGYLERQTRDGRIGSAAFADWDALIEGTHGAIGDALGVPADEVAVTRSTTEGLDLVLFGRSWQPGDEVVTTTSEHPGLTVPLEVLARRHGVRVRAVDVEHPADPVAAIEAALGPRTRLVALSHVLWTTGDELPLQRIAALAHAAGADLLVDGAQGTGCVPVDPHLLDVDYYTVSAQKWLCGPSGTGGLWVRPSLVASLEPAFPGYFSFDFAHPDGPRDWPTARKLDPGSLSLVAMLGLREAVAWWRAAAGPDEGLARAAAIADDVRARLGEIEGVALAEVCGPTPLLAFRIAGVAADEAVRLLEEDGILVRSVPGRDLVRVSIGFFTDDADVATLLDAVDRLAERA